MPKEQKIANLLSKTQIYRDYESAFGTATELPLTLRPRELWQNALRGKKYENPFCALMSKKNRSCAACLRVQEQLVSGAPGQTTTATCFAGFCDTAVPVSAGGLTVAYLQTGQVALQPPTPAKFTKIARQLLEWGTTVNLAAIEDAYFHGKVLSRRQYSAMIRLLEIFAQHLSVSANQLIIEDREGEAPVISRAKQYIEKNQAQTISLDQIAKALNISTFYFCKVFKKATGLTFTDYLGRTRIERAKNLLLNPHARVSEVAYDCGFVSLTHFNRSFKKVVGVSPTQFRTSSG